MAHAIGCRGTTKHLDVVDVFDIEIVEAGNGLAADATDIDQPLRIVVRPDPIDDDQWFVRQQRAPDAPRDSPQLPLYRT